MTVGFFVKIKSFIPSLLIQLLLLFTKFLVDTIPAPHRHELSATAPNRTSWFWFSSLWLEK